MFIKVVTTRVKAKGKRAKKVYQYVRVVDRRYNVGNWGKTEVVIATLGTLADVRRSAETLVHGLTRLAGRQ